MKPVFWLAVALVGVLTACGGDKKDTVVGVEIKCDLRAGTQSEERCKQKPDTYYNGTYRELTVRTEKGTTYKVRVDMETNPAVGAPWPPE